MGHDPTSIFTAVQDGNVDAVRSLLNQNPRLVKATNASGWRILNQAVSCGHYEIVELLLAQGADIHAKYRGRSLIHDALPHREVIELLLFHGADPNGKNEVGEKPLHRAVMFWREESPVEAKRLVELLLANGADPKAVGRDEFTPLHLAVTSGSPAAKEIVQLLIRYGAQVNAKGKHDATPLHLATLEGSADLVQVLLANGAYIEARDCLFRTPLHNAACSGQHAIVEALLLHGADLAVKDHSGMTAVHSLLTYSKPSLAVLEVLVSHGADVNARENRDHWTPLHFVAARENAETQLVEFFAKHNSLINAQDRYGRTPLQIANKNGNAAVEDLLRSLGGQ